MNYFDFFEIEESFIIDEAALKRAYLLNSRKFHPDYFTLDSTEAQEEALQLSSMNNDAFNTLRNFDLRMKYILDLNGVLEEEGQNQVPSDFLMEMMEFNEVLMEMEMDEEIDGLDETKQKVNAYSSTLLEDLMPHLAAYKDASEEEKQDILNKVKDYYLKNKYLLRIKQKLNTFASL